MKFVESSKFTTFIFAALVAGLIGFSISTGGSGIKTAETKEVKAKTKDRTEIITYKIPDAPAGQPKEIIVEKRDVTTTEKSKAVAAVGSTKKKNQISILKDLNAKTFMDETAGWRMQYWRRIGESDFKVGVEGTSTGSISAGVSIEF